MIREESNRPSSPTKHRYRVGVVVDSVEDDYEVSVLRGVMQHAAEVGVRVVTFAGSEGAAASLNDQLFELVSADSVDGLVVLSGALMHHVGADALRRLLGRFGSLPLCTVGAKVAAETSILVDNESGMAELIDHLVERRGHKTVAFITGPEGNEEAARRLAAYRATLEKHGIAYDPKLVVPGDFRRRSGEQAVQTLFGERGFNHRALDAIVAADDAMAQGALQTLLRRDVRVPRELAVAGFDDVAAGRVCDPPLTTVRQPLEEIGAAALDLVLKQLAGETTEDVRFATRLIVRRSCGGDLAAAPSAAVEGGTLRDHMPVLISRLESMSQGRLSPLGTHWAEKLVEALVKQLEGRAPEAFRGKYEEYLHVLGPLDVDLGVFHDVLGTLRQAVDSLVKEGSPQAIAAEALFLDLSQRTGMAVERAIVRRRVRAEQASLDLRTAVGDLAATFDLESVAAALQANLPRLGIQRLFLAARTGQTDADGRPLARLLLCYDDKDPERLSRVDDGGRSSVPPASRKPQDSTRAAVPTLPKDLVYPMHELLPRELVPDDSRAYVVKPVSFGDEPLGLVMMSIGAWEPFAYESLRQSFGTFLKGGELLARVETARSLVAGLDADARSSLPEPVQQALSALEAKDRSWR